MIRQSRKVVFASMFSVAALSLATLAHANEPEHAAAVYQGDAAKGQPIASAVCGACHGADGNSMAPTFPKLAGQHAAYLFKQMKNFKPNGDGNVERNNPIMLGMVAAYDENQMKDFAAYFASQKPAAGAMADKDKMSLGQKLYRAGDASKGLPACAACHGPNGSGLPAQFPRLAGQHAMYTETQLKAFRNSERANDPNKMMQTIALKMTDAEIAAVSDYIAGLH